MVNARVSLAVCAVLVLGGCLGGPKGGKLPADARALTFDPNWAELAVPFGDGHDHKDPASHNHSTPNFKVAGWNPLLSTHYGTTPGGHLCGDSADGGSRRYSAVQGAGDVGFILVDVTDGSRPQVVGEFVTPTSTTRDVALTPDGKYVVLGQSTPHAPEKGVPGAPIAVGSATWRSQCNDGPVTVPVQTSGPEQNVPWGAGVLLVSIADPKTPKIVDYWPLPVLGAHSIYANTVGDNTYVLASVVNLVAAVTYFELLQIVPAANGGKLVHLSYILEEPTQGNAPVINGHNDGVIMTHPGNGKVYAWLAHWHQGLVIVDLSNPRTPTIVGRWTDNPPGNTNVGTNDAGDIHEALPSDSLWNGKHYTFVGQEILGHPTKRPSGYMRAIDTTDPTHPRPVAIWSLPVDVEWGATLQFSTHYLSPVNHTVFISHYHAGVWAIDVSDIQNHTDLPSIGAFLPTFVSPKPMTQYGRGYSWTPTVMETNAMRNGDIIVWDSSSGCYVVQFDASQPAPARTWPNA
jgi:hypothetical protein